MEGGGRAVVILSYIRCSKKTNNLLTTCTALHCATLQIPEGSSSHSRQTVAPWQIKEHWTTQYTAIQHNTVQCNAIQHIIQHNAVQYITIEHNTIQ
jgi:hypothetical protein